MHDSIWLGVDVASQSFHAAVARDGVDARNWAKAPHAEFAHSKQGVGKLLAWLRAQGVAPDELAGVCVESTGPYSHHFAAYANGRLGPISIINPARSRTFARTLGVQHKTDEVDACVLAYFGHSFRPSAAPPRPAVLVALRELCRAYEALYSNRAAHERRLQTKPESKEVRAMYRRVIRALTKEMERLQARMRELIASEPKLRADAKRIASVPGLGERTAQVLLAEFGDLREYNRDELVALAGLYPRQHESGSSVRKRPRLAKGGKANVRAVLYMAAMSALQCNPVMKAFGQRLAKHGKTPMQVLCAVMHKLLRIAHALVKSGQDFDPQHMDPVVSKAA